MSVSARVCERVKSECVCEEESPPWPLRRSTAVGAGPAAGKSRGAGALGARGDKGRDTRSPPPALVPRLSFAQGEPFRPPLAGLCPAAPLDVPGALAGPPALAASVGLVLRPAGVERAGSRGLRLPVLPRSPPRPPGPPTQLPGL